MLSRNIRAPISAWWAGEPAAPGTTASLAVTWRPCSVPAGSGRETSATRGTWCVTGRRVLDVGSNAGYDPFMFKHLGAAEVMACEPFQFIRQMEFLESVYRSGIQPRQMRWQELDPEQHGRFDLVHCHGVLYHEVHPVVLLERLRAMLTDDGTLLFGSMMLADPELSEYARFVPGAYYNDPSWWWVPGRLAMRWMLETVGLPVEEEFGLAPGPPGEFGTVNGYFRARRGEAAAGLTGV